MDLVNVTGLELTCLKPLMQASDVTAKAANLRNKKYLMVHGTADDNVHYQQSMMLARAMEEADVLFRSVEQGFPGIRTYPSKRT